MNIFSQLNYLLDKKKKIGIVVLFIMTTISSALELLGVTIVLPIVDIAMGTGGLDENIMTSLIMRYTSLRKKEEILLCLIGITVILYLVKCIYVSFSNSRQFKFAATVKRDTAIRLMKSYLKQPYSFFLDHNSSELIRAVNTDTGQLFQLISNILTIFSSLLTSLLIVVFLAIENIYMTMMVGIVIGLTLGVIIFVIQKRNRRNGYVQIKLQGFLIKHLQQAFEGVKEIKILNIEKEFIDIYDRTYKKHTEMEVRFSLYNTLPRNLVETFAVIAVLLFLALNIMFNPEYIKLLPQLAAFCVAAFKLLPCVNSIYSSLNVVVYHKAAIDQVYKDIKAADSIVDLIDGIDNSPSIAFCDRIVMDKVDFRYDNAESDVLHQVSLEIPKGKSVALVGPSGGGKTTTADLIISLLSPSSGRIMVDGMDVSENIGGWRKMFGYIPQFIYLTDDSIRRNIAFGIPDNDIDDDRVMKVLEDAQLADFVRNLPYGLDTVVGERGSRISGGQRQRIGIARALYRNPEILVFDEATSALDNETEKEVMSAIDGLHGTKTMIMIAHRLSTIENCDIIYHIENGDIRREK